MDYVPKHLGINVSLKTKLKSIEFFLIEHFESFTKACIFSKMLYLNIFIFTKRLNKIKFLFQHFKKLSVYRKSELV